LRDPCRTSRSGWRRWRRCAHRDTNSPPHEARHALTHTFDRAHAVALPAAVPEPVSNTATDAVAIAEADAVPVTTPVAVALASALASSDGAFEPHALGWAVGSGRSDAPYDGRVSRAKHDLVILLLTLAGGGMVVAADLSKSYIPLFVGWICFGTIPWLLSRMERS